MSACNSYYRRDGTPYGDSLEWARDLEDHQREVMKTTLPDGKLVSTVFIGLCHTFTPDHDKHLIYETMVFASDRDMGDLDCERYATEEDAIIGHYQMVGKWELKIEDQNSTT